MLRISTKDIRILEIAAEVTWPLEACALLEGFRVGDEVTVTQLHLARNIAEDPKKRFEVDPKVLFQVHRDLRSSSKYLVGVWHSHPSGLDEPSEVDLSNAWDTKLIWLITAMHGKYASRTSAFKIEGDGDAIVFIPLAMTGNL